MDKIIVSFDMDWAPDFAIDFTAQLIHGMGIKSVWFMTHRSLASQRVESMQEAEIGIHPNFLQGSTQGKNTKQVMDNLMKEFPKAKSVRTHGMVYSASIAHMFAMYGFDIDSSVFLGGMKGIQPFVTRYNGGQKILRVPYYWSDDGEMAYGGDWKHIDISSPGLKVMCFHPLHIFLNTDNWETYLNYKENFVSQGLLPDARSFINTTEYGVMNFLIDLFVGLSKIRFGSFDELRKEYLCE